MKKSINAGIKAIIFVLLFSNLTSCRSAHELNKIAIVMGIGIDKGKETVPVGMTIQIANVSGIKSASMQGGSGAASNASFFNLKESGKSISEVTRTFTRKLNRKLFFAHNQVIIFGKDAAEDGIDKYMDFFLRYRETRLLVWILVAKGSASDILNVEPRLETNPGANIAELIKNEQNISQLPAVNLKDFASRMMSKTTAPIAPIIEVSKDNNKKIAYLSDTAVFKKYKMVGTLDKKETRGLLWGINKVKNGIIVLKEEDGNDSVTIAITHATSKISSKIKDKEPTIKIEIKAEGDLEEQTSSKDLANPKAFEILEKSMEKSIKEEVMASLEKSRELNADIFGFGDIIYQHYPKQWSKIEKDWDEIYPVIHVDVSVDAKLRKTGRITKPIFYKEK